MDKIIYLDNAATTAPDAEVVKRMREAMTEEYFNPSALYTQALNASLNIRRARETAKSAMHAPDGEIYFTSGGTEANNTALFSTRKPRGSRIIIGMGEHDSVFAGANELTAQGYDVQLAPINSDGTVAVGEFKRLLNENVSLVSVMHASNETGGINDVALLARLTKQVAPRALFHSDGVQAFGKIPVNLRTLGVDLYSISAHKLHGPRGIGALWVKKGVSLKPLISGGGQEKGMRSGTENYPAIVGFESAINHWALNSFDENYSKILNYREYLAAQISAHVKDAVIITDLHNSVPGILTVAFKDVRGEVLLHALEKHSILVGIGSACSSHRESRFKGLLGLDERHRDGIVRFSMSSDNDIGEVDRVVKAIADELFVLAKFRRI